MWIVLLALRRPYTFVVADLVLLLLTPFVLLRNAPWVDHTSEKPFHVDFFYTESIRFFNSARKRRRQRQSAS
jgi:hypothetical protein